MNLPPAAFRVVVVGAGVLGTSVALHLVRRGARVVLVTEAAPASGASGRSLAWLNSAGERSAAYHRLRLAALDRYRALAADPASRRFLRLDGGLTWAGPGESLRNRHRHEVEVGYPSVWLGPEDVAARIPGVAGVASEGAIFNPGEGWADLTRMIEAFLAEFTARGGELRAGAGRARPRLASGRAAGVRLADGEAIHADAVVLATGAALPADVAPFGVRIPEATSSALLVRSKPVPSPLRVVLNTPRVAVRPTPEGGFAFDSAWSEREVEALEGGGYRVLDCTVARLVAEASAVLAGTPRLEVDGYGVGAKPIPADGEPVVGELEQVPGLHVVFTHSGATLALILGALIAAEVVDGERDDRLAPFRPSRFAPP